MMDDASLLAATREGKIEAFRQIVERYQNLVCAVAYSATGDRILSEDVGQETFLVAWHRLTTLREPAKLAAWLCGIARNLGRKAVRGRRREKVTDVHDLDRQVGGDSGPLETMLDHEAEAAVWQALETLPARYREPLVLFYREEQSIAQVARGLGLSEETAKQRLSRGRRSLQQGIEQQMAGSLAAGRPRKGFAAAVLAALAASAGGAAAASAPAAGAASSTGWRLVAAGLASVVALGLGLVAFRSLRSGQPDAAGPGELRSRQQREIVAHLRRAREALGASAADSGSCELGGTVTGSDGKPAAGALVAVADQATSALDPTVFATDDAGRWELGRRPLGEYLLSVTAPGQQAESRLFRCTGSADQDHRIALRAGGTPLAGAVTDVGGGPVPDATVWVIAEETPGDGQAFAARTGADGTYQLLLPRGLYMVLATHPEYTLGGRPLSLGDSPAREDFTLVPGGAIEGTVVSAGSGRPIGGARITSIGLAAADTPAEWLLPLIFGAVFPVVADQDGRFRIGGLPPGRIRLSARSDGFALQEPARIDLALAEERPAVTIPLDPAFTLSGFVVRRGDERRGIEGVRVVALRTGTGFEGPAVGLSDRSGYFTVTGLAPGRYRLIALGPSSAPLVVVTEMTVADRDIDDLLLVAERGAVLRGHVEPPGPVAIQLEPATAADRSPASVAAAIATALIRAEVDARGNFALPAVPPGDYVIVASSYQQQGRLPITVATADLTGLVVAARPRPAVAGQVLLASGLPAVGVVVSAKPERRGRPAASLGAARTDGQGRFHIVGVAAGPNELRVFDGRGQRPWSGGAGEAAFEPRAVEVPASGAASVSLEVAGGGKRLAGRVVGPDGAPVSDAWIQVDGRAGQRVPAFYQDAPILTDAAGRFTVDGLFGDDFDVSANGPRGNLRAVARQVPAGRDAALELRPVATLTGTVEFQGKPVPEFEVVVRRGKERVATVTGEDGAFRIPDVITGAYQIEIESPVGYAVSTIDVTGDPTTVQPELTPWASVRGRLLGDDGKPRAGVSLHMDMGEHSLLEARASRDHRVVTGADGSFVLDHLTEGRREVRSIDPLLRIEVDLKAGEEIDLGAVDPRLGMEQTSRSASDDLGVQFFLGTAAPSDAELAALDRDPALAYRGRSEADARVWIARVAAGSPAGAAGLRRGDQVVAVGRRPTGRGPSALATMMSLSTRWRSRGRAVDWVVRRGDRELRVAVTVPAQGSSMSDQVLLNWTR